MHFNLLQLCSFMPLVFFCLLGSSISVNSITRPEISKISVYKSPVTEDPRENVSGNLNCTFKYFLWVGKNNLQASKS